RSTHGGLLAGPGSLPPPPATVVRQQTRSVQSADCPPAGAVSLFAGPGLSAPARAGLYWRLLHRQSIRAYCASQAPARVPHPGLCSRGVCSSRLGLLRRSARGANESTPELFCDGPVLQPHAVCRVHRLADHGTLSGVSPTCL